MFCTNCGGQNPNTARFCGHCGTAVAASPPAALPLAEEITLAPSRTPEKQIPGANLPPPPSVIAPAKRAPPPPNPIHPVTPANTSAYPAPPNMHWVIVLILSAFTYGLGALVWSFKQAFFVKKLDSESKGVLYLGLATAAMATQVVLYFIMASTFSSGYAALTMVSILNLVIIVLGLIAIFGMRSTLLKHYNTIEPIGLRLSGIMTFFFSILYFQYHFSRIAKRKKTVSPN